MFFTFLPFVYFLNVFFTFW